MINNTISLVKYVKEAVFHDLKQLTGLTHEIQGKDLIFEKEFIGR